MCLASIPPTIIRIWSAGCRLATWSWTGDLYAAPLDELQEKFTGSARFSVFHFCQPSKHVLQVQPRLVIKLLQTRRASAVLH
mmetsp:Transcript_84456/g.229316  ORF Transcript_84456/g.229316 Transcript_84456/m.229316 type:complete len:82 (-) Transcript_84456:457-702(-)